MKKKKEYYSDPRFQRRDYIDFKEIYPLLKICIASRIKVTDVYKDFFHLEEDKVYFNVVNGTYNPMIPIPKHTHYWTLVKKREKRKKTHNFEDEVGSYCDISCWKSQQQPKKCVIL